MEPWQSVDVDGSYLGEEDCRAVVKSPQNNLTGTCRKTRDRCVDFVNQVTRWEELNSEGFNIIKSISNSLIENGEVPTASDTKLILKLQTDADKLGELINQLKSVVDKLENLTLLTRETEKLEIQSNMTSGFPLLSTSDIGDIFADITAMHQKELEVKKVIKNNICFDVDKDVFLVYSAAWIHQPYIDSNLGKLIDITTLGTGLN
ncbi:hypothetical protein HELRODRAFT_169462 [Helobdella robusta]|uniref:Uncharacterized protein n=1 Tax=Helobdella robusta TaxID=6412 RepID=T1F1Z0_HELRO|nr:hypothetical protein HELRODRAFT_169462 [Helobdella robusta]ESO08588.1 hypothetical protein HELRODRAFT_169462 [Helobdella robusta]